MEQYPVPQFIQQEGRIIFFLSFRQFFYMVGAGVIDFFLFYILPWALFIIIGPAIFIASVAFAFLKINNMTLAELLFSSIGFSMGGKNYVWKKQESPYPFRPIKRTKIQKLEKKAVLQAQPSQLKKIKTEVEMRTK